MPDHEPQITDDFAKLCDIVTKLRSSGGCPWDREQTNGIVTPSGYRGGIRNGRGRARSERCAFSRGTGDLLLLVVMHAQIARETRRFDIAEVIGQVSDKLIRRHPHVFGTSEARDSGAVLKQWEAIKREEKNADSHSSPVCRRLYRAGAHGKGTVESSPGEFRLDSTRNVMAKVEEELGETKEAIRSQQRERIEEEIGYMLFAVVNLARKCKIDAETALQSATDKFVARFNRLEDELKARGRKLGEVELAEMDAIWDEIKNQG